MAASVLDPYRDDILSLHRNGTKQKDILHWLQSEHEVSIGRTALSAFIRAETGGHSAASPAALPDYDAAQELLRTYLQTARANLNDAAELKEDMNRLHRIVQGVSEKLDTLEITPQDKPAPGSALLLPAVVRGIWIRASLATVGVEFILLMAVLYWRS